MRYIISPVLLLVCFSLAVIASFTVTPPARTMRPTIYDDGKSCPNGCDAHVVFNPVHNETRNAFDPASSRSAPRTCIVGQQCKICFSEDDSSCMLAIYRGGGPAPGRFDFTPAFYEENCSKANLPSAFAKQCRSAQPAVDQLKRKINCIANPEHEKCKGMMEAFAKRKAVDDLLYEECKSMTEAAFNHKYKDKP